ISMPPSSRGSMATWRSERTSLPKGPASDGFVGMQVALMLEFLHHGGSESQRDLTNLQPQRTRRITKGNSLRYFASSTFKQNPFTTEDTEVTGGRKWRVLL